MMISDSTRPLSNNMNSHILPIPLKKPYECVFPGCDKSFSTSSNLTQHVLIHTDERPHVCDLCGRAFRQSGNLSKHKKSHENAHLRWDRSTNSKPFKCTEVGCEKSFTANNSLQNHMRKHTGEQPYACPFEDCADRFMLKTGLQTHMKMHEALLGQRSLCLHSGCRKTFKNQEELRAHIYATCPGLVEEALVLRTYLADIVHAFGREGEEDDNADSSSGGEVETAVGKARDLLALLERESSEPATDVPASPKEAYHKISASWRLHKDAAVEVASSTVVSIAKQNEAVQGGGGGGGPVIIATSTGGGGGANTSYTNPLSPRSLLLSEPGGAGGISTLLMAATQTAGLNNDHDDPAALYSMSGSYLLGLKRPLDSRGDYFTEKFFRPSPLHTRTTSTHTNTATNSAGIALTTTTSSSHISSNPAANTKRATYLETFPVQATYDDTEPTSYI